MIHFIKKKLQTEFTKNIITVLGGSTFSTLLPILISPVLTRLFSVTEIFAPFTFFISTCYIIASIANSHYTNAILVADTDEEAIGVFQISTLLNGIAFLVITVLLFCIGKPMMHYFNAPNSFIHFLFLVPFTIATMGLYANFLQWNFRQQQFKRVALSRMLQATITGIVQILMGIFVHQINGLIIGFVVGQLASLIALSMFTYFDNKNLFKLNSNNNLKKYAKKYNHFFKFQTIADFINVLTQQMPTFLLGKFNFIQEVGWFGFANRIIIAPSSIITGAIGDVFRQKAAADYIQKNNAIAIFKKTLKILLATMLLPSIIVLFGGPQIFSWLFGIEWRVAGQYAQVLIIMLFPKFIVSPLSYMFIIAGKQKEDFFLHLYIFFSTMASFYIGYQIFHSAIGMLSCFSANYACIYLIYFIRSFTFAKGKNSLQ